MLEHDYRQRHSLVVFKRSNLGCAWLWRVSLTSACLSRSQSILLGFTLRLLTLPHLGATLGCRAGRPWQYLYLSPGSDTPRSRRRSTSTGTSTNHSTKSAPTASNSSQPTRSRTQRARTWMGAVGKRPRNSQELMRRMGSCVVEVTGFEPSPRNRPTPGPAPRHTRQIEPPGRKANPRQERDRARTGLGRSDRWWR